MENPEKLAILGTRMDNPERLATLGTLNTRRQTKQKQKTQYAGHHYTETNTNNIIKTWVLLQTTGGKDEPNIVFMRKT